MKINKKTNSRKNNSKKTRNSKKSNTKNNKNNRNNRNNKKTSGGFQEMSETQPAPEFSESIQAPEFSECNPKLASDYSGTTFNPEAIDKSCYVANYSGVYGGALSATDINNMRFENEKLPKVFDPLHSLGGGKKALKNMKKKLSNRKKSQKAGGLLDNIKDISKNILGTSGGNSLSKITDTYKNYKNKIEELEKSAGTLERLTKGELDLEDKINKNDDNLKVVGGEHTWSNLSRGNNGVNANLSVQKSVDGKIIGDTTEYNLLEGTTLYNGGKRENRNKEWMNEVKNVMSTRKVNYATALKIASQLRKDKNNKSNKNNKNNKK